MTDNPASTTPTDRILTTLQQQGECSRGDLLDAAQVQSYSELNPILESLLQQGKITVHWHALGFRTYRLSESRPAFPPWMQTN